MREISLFIKVITPTLMGGGFGQNDGIRSSEIKGLMRYWFRAVAGSFIIHFPENKFKQDLENLKKFEGDIFGSTNVKSSFRLIVEENNIDTINLVHLPHKPWGKRYPSNVIPPSQDYNFTLKISINRIPFKNVEVEEYEMFIKNILKLTFFFGVGFRKNRFFGNLLLENEENKDIKDLVNNLKKFISKNFKINGINYGIEKKKTLLPLFPTFSYRDENQKNYYIEKILNNCKFNNWEFFLEKFYKEVIHKIEKNNKLRFFIDGGIHNKKFHKSSLLNLSYIDGNIYLSSFFHKNNGYLDNKNKYEDWKNGLGKIDEIIKSSGLCSNGN